EIDQVRLLEGAPLTKLSLREPLRGAIEGLDELSRARGGRLHHADELPLGRVTVDAPTELEHAGPVGAQLLRVRLGVLRAIHVATPPGRVAAEGDVVSALGHAPRDGPVVDDVRVG